MSLSRAPTERIRARVSRFRVGDLPAFTLLPRIDDPALEQDRSGGVIGDVEQEWPVNIERLDTRQSLHRDAGSRGRLCAFLSHLDHCAMNDLVNAHGNF